MFLEEERYRNIISWSDDGKHFTVHDVNRFTTDVMPEHFSHTNFSSFVRQLNSYVSPRANPPRPPPGKTADFSSPRRRYRDRIPEPYAPPGSGA